MPSSGLALLLLIPLHETQDNQGSNSRPQFSKKRQFNSIFHLPSILPMSMMMTTDNTSELCDMDLSIWYFPLILSQLYRAAIPEI